MARRCWRIGLWLASTLALSLNGACGGSSSDLPPSDAGRDLKPATSDGGREKPSRDDAASPDGRRDAATGDAAKDATASDATDAVDALAADCTTGPAGEATELRCSGLYADWASKTVASDVQQYDPGLHLWSDGASKTRWIYLPPGTKIDSSNMDEWTFSPGTKVWKEFVVGGVRIETRLIWKRPTGAWYFTTYLWSADETSTAELTTGKLDADGNGYEVPTQNACYDCHGGRFSTRSSGSRRWRCRRRRPRA